MAGAICCPCHGSELCRSSSGHSCPSPFHMRVVMWSERYSSVKVRCDCIVSCVVDWKLMVLPNNSSNGPGTSVPQTPHESESTASMMFAGRPASYDARSCQVMFWVAEWNVGVDELAMPLPRPFPFTGQSRARCVVDPHPWQAITLPSFPLGFCFRPKP